MTFASYVCTVFNLDAHVLHLRLLVLSPIILTSAPRYQRAPHPPKSISWPFFYVPFTTHIINTIYSNNVSFHKLLLQYPTLQNFSTIPHRYMYFLCKPLSYFFRYSSHCFRSLPKSSFRYVVIVYTNLP